MKLENPILVRREDMIKKALIRYREDDNSPSSRAVVNNDGAIPPLPQISSWRGA
jgi:hypothetical protein